jgi:hypothetical protein
MVVMYEFVASAALNQFLGLFLSLLSNFSKLGPAFLKRVVKTINLAGSPRSSG